MTQTSMEQTLSHGRPNRFVATFTAHDIIRVWGAATRFILSLLILTILPGLAGGVVKTFLDLRLLLSADLEVALRRIIVNALSLLAVVNVLKTTLPYCSNGRVRVTIIVDSLPVVMLTQIISRWFTGGEWHRHHIGVYAHCGYPLQPVANGVYAAGQSIRAIIFTISLGGAYVDQFSS